MFNPDSPNEKKSSSNNTNYAQMGAEVMSDKQKIKFYILEGGMASCYGFKLTQDKRLEIVDLSKLNRFDAHTKSILRELYQELKK